METHLVDLSLFTISPTNDNLFSLPDEALSASAFGPRQKTKNNAATMKPLPPIPHRRLGAFSRDPRAASPNSNRTVLERVKKLRVEPTTPTRDSLSPTQCQTQTLQQRRNPDSVTPTLTIPTPSHQTDTTRIPASAAATTTPRPAAPMIWLADEEMWLVADSVQPNESRTDLYGYYAPAPRTDPAPFGDNQLDDYEAPPAYSASPISEPSPSDFSPIRTQFSSLLESQSNFDNNRTINSTSLNQPRNTNEREDMSPMFQAAISGVGFDTDLQRTGTMVSRQSNRRDSWHSESIVSPMSTVTEKTSRWRIHRTSSARH